MGGYTLTTRSTKKLLRTLLVQRDLNNLYACPLVFVFIPPISVNREIKKARFTWSMLVERSEMCGQIFGPVQSILKFRDIDEVIDMANDTHYGLAAYIFTKDLDTAIRVSSSLEAGVIWWVWEEIELCKSYNVTRRNVKFIILPAI